MQGHCRIGLENNSTVYSVQSHSEAAAVANDFLFNLYICINYKKVTDPANKSNHKKSRPACQLCGRSRGSAG